MAEEFNVSCPKCATVFAVTRELCGEMAECSECTTVFEIPFPEESPAVETTDTGAIKGIAAQPEEIVDATNTVKLSRTGIGMIPNLKDSFEFGPKNPPTQPSPPQQQKPSGTQFNIPPAQRPVPPPMQQPPAQRPPVQQQAPSSPMQQTQPPPMQVQGTKKPTFKKPPTNGSTQTQQTAQAIHPSQTQTVPAPITDGIIKIPAWAKVIIHKDEEVYACSESKDNAFLIAGLVSLPSFLCIVMPFLGSWGAAGAAVISIATFATVVLIVSDSGKKLLILTSQRAISVFGKKKLEAKK